LDKLVSALVVGQPLVLAVEAAAAEEEGTSSASTDGVFPVLETPPYLARKLPQAWLDKVGQGGDWGGGEAREIRRLALL